MMYREMGTRDQTLCLFCFTNFERIRTIARTVDVSLVLHGSSGRTDNDFRQAIQKGISKVNIFTNINIASVKVELVAANLSDTFC